MRRELIVVRQQLRKRKTINLVRIGFLIALAGVGSYLKFPSPVGSIALDSVAGYLGVLLLGIESGSVVLVIGHLLSAFLSGLPLGGLHGLIAILMGGCGFIFGYSNRRNSIIAILITSICNGILLPGLLTPILGMGFVIGLMPMLLGSSIINILLAVLLSKFLLRSNFYED